MKDYEKMQTLGNGAFGEVWLVRSRKNHQLYAIKVIDQESENSKYSKNEIKYKINHPNIARLYYHFMEAKFLYIVMEYVNGGNLAECLNKHRNKYGVPFPEEIVQHLMKQILQAVDFLHSKEIVHRDLKLENIMVHFDNENDRQNCNMLKSKVKIVDFGLCTHLNKDKLITSIKGTINNIDPYLVQHCIKSAQNLRESNRKSYNEKCDIWSIGTVCYELAIGKKVFEVKNINELCNKIQVGKFKLPKTLSFEIISFLNSMLVFDPNERSSAKELLNHIFIKQNPKYFRKIEMEEAPQIKKQNPKKSIWSLFKEEDKLIKIQKNNYYEHKNNNIYTNNKISLPINHSYSGSITYQEEVKKNKEKYGNFLLSFYGQPMSLNANNFDNNNNINNININSFKKQNSSPINQTNFFNDV